MVLSPDCATVVLKLLFSSADIGSQCATSSSNVWDNVYTLLSFYIGLRSVELYKF